MKRFFGKVFFFLSIFSAPFLVGANVRLNEIAWMGTDEKSDDEWIEFYNDGTEQADISGWKLGWGGGKYEILFGKEKCTNTIIPAGGYLLLGGSTGFSLPGVTADCVYPSLSLANDGVLLTLNDLSTEIDRVDGSDKWAIGGSNEKPKKTAQLSPSGWVTAAATPRAANASESSVPVGSEENASTTEPAVFSDDEDESSVSGLSSHSSSVGISKTSVKTKVALSMARDRIALAGSPINFSAKYMDDAGKTLSGGSFLWSFGDGYSFAGQSVEHSYDLPGEYIVILNSFYEGTEYVGRSKIVTVVPAFEIVAKEQDGKFYAEIQNRAQTEVNLKGWRLSVGRKNFVFAADTIILAGKKLPVSSKILGFEILRGEQIDLISPAGKSHASFVLETEKLPILAKDKAVDKAVDNFTASSLGNETTKWVKELVVLKDKLVELQKTYVANSGLATVSVTSGGKSSLIAPFLSKKEPPANTAKNAVSSSTKIVLKLEDKGTGISGFWGYLKNLFYR